MAVKVEAEAPNVSELGEADRLNVRLVSLIWIERKLDVAAASFPLAAMLALTTQVPGEFAVKLAPDSVQGPETY